MKDIMSIKKRLEQKSAINGKAGVAIMSGINVVNLMST